jgi:tetratricopeptide (TPR) repeat protein
LVPALKHFQDAYKLDSTLVEALRQARAVYWDLGKTNMVQKLLELELMSTAGHPSATELLVELGDVFCDAGEWGKASTAYSRALDVSAGESREARHGVDDLKLDKATFRARIDLLLAGATTAGAARGRRYLRAARIARRFHPAEIEDLLARAYAADPRDKAAAAAYEQLLLDEDRAEAIIEAQRRILDGLSGAARGDVAFRYGARWATRHQNPEVAARFFEEALMYQPNIDSASWYLRDYRSGKLGE